MSSRLLVFVIFLGLLSPSLQILDDSFKQRPFIEATLCTTGAIIRIPLGEPEDNDTPEHHRACHAICSRDQECDGKA